MDKLFPTPDANTRGAKKSQKSQQLTFSQVDFPANRSPKPGSDLARKMTVVSGEKCYELSKSQCRLGLLVKMLLESSIWNSTIVYLNWKVKATKRRRLLYQLVPSQPPTDEIEFGLLPTPAARDWKAFQVNVESIKKMMETHQICIVQILLLKGYMDCQILNAYEEIMGYPIGWTDLKHSETQSCLPA